MDIPTSTAYFNKVRGPTIATTLELIRELHAGQYDDRGDAYVYHPQRVAMNLLKIYPCASDEMVMAALLHDVIEDCRHLGVDIEFLRRKGYPEETLEIVELLTKPEGDDRPYGQVIGGIITSGNRDAMIVKIADNMDNLHPERVLRKARYTASIKRLADAVGLNEDYIFNAIYGARPLNELKAELERA